MRVLERVGQRRTSSDSASADRGYRRTLAIERRHLTPERSCCTSMNSRITDAWHRFAPWIGGLLQLEHGSGVDAIRSAYRDALAGGVGPDTAKVLTW